MTAARVRPLLLSTLTGLFLALAGPTASHAACQPLVSGQSQVDCKLDEIRRAQQDAEQQRQMDEWARRNREANQRMQDDASRANRDFFCRQPGNQSLAGCEAYR